MSQSIKTMLTAPRGLLVVLAALAALTAAGCGDELSPSSVARVGESTIEKSEFDHWLENAARTQQAALTPVGAGEDPVVPVPPDFTECVEAKEQQAQAAVDQAQSAQGPQAPPPELPSTDELRQQCEQEYDLLKEQVMQFLIQTEAVEQEAEERGIEVTEEEVSAQFEDLKQQAYPSDEQYQQFLETSGMTEEDLLFQVRLDLLISEIRKDVLAEAAEVSDEEVATYYEENQDRPPIGQPEQRDVNVVVTRTEEQAERARKAIEDGQDFARVAQEFSVDPASRSRGGKLTVQEGSEEAAFDEAAFEAKKGELVGPIETELGWYVFEVTDIQEASTQSLEESRDAIVEILRTEQEQEVLTEFQEQFEAEAREETICAEEFVIVGCSNGPDPEEAPPPGVPPEGAPPPVPPEGAPPPQGAPVPVPEGEAPAPPPAEGGETAPPEE